MAKVHYVQGRYRDAQGMCARVGLEELTRDDQPTYHLRLLAEAFVIKGSQNLGLAQDINSCDHNLTNRRYGSFCSGKLNRTL